MKNIVLILTLFFLTKCKTMDKNQSADSSNPLLHSSNYGGWEKTGFTILKSQDELNQIMTNSAELDTNHVTPFPVKNKLLFYNFGTYNNGNHKVEKITNLWVENKNLHIDILLPKPTKYSIMAIANPWMLVEYNEKLQFDNIIIHIKENNK